MKRIYLVFIILSFIGTVSISTNSLIIVPMNDQSLTLNTSEEIVFDGIIDDGEYSHNASFGSGDFNLFWSIGVDTIYFGMEGATTGWVSLGIEPTFAMKDADMIFGWVLDNGTVEILDAFSTGNYGPHPPDTELGGTNDILSFNGSQKDSITIIEFSRPLDTGDNYDKAIPLNATLDIIWALGSSDDYTSSHSSRGGEEIFIPAEELPTTTSPPTTTPPPTTTTPTEPPTTDITSPSSSPTDTTTPTTGDESPTAATGLPYLFMTLGILGTLSLVILLFGKRRLK
ncbi:MAG: hypothetical protein GF308_08300 [Candidatus Heimdallarchaeota archaeon]|nr:hypothetical protein [Candidatus Heimdallarchaeota archaeon]